MARLLRNSGAEDGAFAARLLTEKLVEEADLVLALTRGHRSLVVDLWPPAVRRTFTLREFARLLEKIDPSALPDGTPAERLRAAIASGSCEAGPPARYREDDDVVDPYRLSDEVYAASFAEIAAAVESHRRMRLQEGVYERPKSSIRSFRSSHGDYADSERVALTSRLPYAAPSALGLARSSESEYLGLRFCTSGEAKMTRSRRKPACVRGRPAGWSRPSVVRE